MPHRPQERGEESLKAPFEVRPLAPTIINPLIAGSISRLGILVLQRHLNLCAVGLPTHRAVSAPCRHENALTRRVRRPAAQSGVVELTTSY